MEKDTSTELVAQPLSAIEAQGRAECDMQIATAKRYPMHSDARGIERFRNEATALATLDEETSASCMYALTRAGKTIPGPSIRLAEIAASAYGNLKYGYRVMDIGERMVTVQGVAHDLERNVAVSAEVQRRITDKGGRRYSDDMIIVTCNAAGAIAARNAIFKAIPAALIKPIYDAAKLKATGGKQTLEMRRVGALQKFALIGVNEARLLARLKHQSTSQITTDDLAALIGLYNAITSNEQNVDEVFPPIEALPVADPGAFQKPSEAAGLLAEDPDQDAETWNAEMARLKAEEERKAKE